MPVLVHVHTCGIAADDAYLDNFTLGVASASGTNMTMCGRVPWNRTLQRVRKHYPCKSKGIGGGGGLGGDDPTIIIIYTPRTVT